MNTLRHTLNIIGDVIMLASGATLIFFMLTDSGPLKVPVTFILCLVLVPVIAHTVAMVAVWRLVRRPAEAYSALIGMVTSTVVTFVWGTFVLTLLELALQGAVGLPAWQLAVSLLVACVIPLASALNLQFSWRVLSTHLKVREGCGISQREGL